MQIGDTACSPTANIARTIRAGMSREPTRWPAMSAALPTTKATSPSTPHKSTTTQPSITLRQNARRSIPFIGYAPTKTIYGGHRRADDLPAGPRCCRAAQCPPQRPPRPLQPSAGRSRQPWSPRNRPASPPRWHGKRAAPQAPETYRPTITAGEDLSGVWSRNSCTGICCAALLTRLKFSGVAALPGNEAIC